MIATLTLHKKLDTIIGKGFFDFLSQLGEGVWRVNCIPCIANVFMIVGFIVLMQLCKLFPLTVRLNQL